MRNQLNELKQLTHELKDALKKLDIQASDKMIISDNITAYTARGNDYISVKFQGFPNAVDITSHTLYTGEYVTSNIDFVNVTDEHLDAIVLRSKTDIANFIAKLDANMEQERLDKINALREQLAKLENYVSNS